MVKDAFGLYMKKIAPVIFFILIFTAVNNSLLAQASLHFNVGYLFPLFGSELNPYNSSITGITSSDIHSSWGKGGSFGASVDYKFNKYLDLEIGATYRYGSTVSYNDTIGGLTNSTSDHLRLFVFSLGDIYNFKCHKSITPYLGAGMILGVDDDVIIAETSNDDFGNSTIFNSKLTCSPAFGAYGKFGINFQLSPGFSFFSELSASVLSITPENLSVSSVNQNGTDITNTLMPYQQETEYSKTTSNQPFTQLQPNKEMTQSIPASSWGISIGIVFSLRATPSPKEKSPANN